MLHDIYVIGSLENPEIPIIANKLRTHGWDVFDDWVAAGETADRAWRAYEEARGHDYVEALCGFAADHVCQYDRHHLDQSRTAVLVLPAGRSGCLELGIAIGAGRPGYILLAGDVAPKWDVMFRNCHLSGGCVCRTVEELIEALGQQKAIS